ncbi:MAG: hypothetical protein AAF409_07520 [Pseudomonadota bacterium]
MSDDRKPGPDGPRDAQGDQDPLFSQPGEGDASSGTAAEAGGDSEVGAPAGRAKMTPPIDEDAIAKHRAAKEARIRKRMEARRAAQGHEGGARADSDQGPDRMKGHGPDHVKKEGARGPKTGKGSALPALRPNLKADTPALRAERVEAIRRDLVRRRRRKGVGMLVKLWVFVVLPTILVGYFMWFMASDLYKSESQFVVRSAEGQGSAGGFLGALIGGGGGAFDPNAVETYILSRDVLRLLDSEHGWIAHFQRDDLDFVHKLALDASFEDAYSHYTQMMEISFDPTEGLVILRVIATDPESSERFSRAVIGYAEEMVNRLSDRIQTDSVRDADRNLVQAEERLRIAQEAVAELQKALDIFTVEGEVSAEMTIISGMEVELEALRGRLTNLRRVTSEDDPRVERIRNQVETLKAQIAARRAKMTGSETEGETSLAEINLALTKARFEVEAATAIFSAAIERREVAYAQARQQSRYLELVATPSRPDSPNYPKKIETTALAFFIFLGAYIVGSLTISLIREQASI